MDGIIDKEIYLQKKDELVRLKVDAVQQKKDRLQKGQIWLEPLRHWLHTLSHAESLIERPDFPKTKVFLEKIGTNRILLNKKVSMCFALPYSYVLADKGFQADEENKVGEIKTGYAKENSSYPAWYPKRLQTRTN